MSAINVIDIGYLKKKINSVATGIQNVAVNSTNDGILFTTKDGNTIDIKLPNFHKHDNLDSVLQKFSYDSASGKLLFDSNEIPNGVLTEDETKEIWDEIKNNK